MSASSMTILRSPTPGQTHAPLLLLRAAVLELAGVLNEVLDALASVSRGDVSWLRPLAVAAVAVEFAATERAPLNPAAMDDACREASDVLSGEGRAGSAFVSRYSRERGASISIAALHRRALLACRNLELRLSWQAHDLRRNGGPR